MDPFHASFHYVYILRSVHHPEKTYIGYTRDLKTRIREHNLGYTTHTRKFRPWEVETAIAFSSKYKALAFERYLKSHSGKAFTTKRLVS